MAGQHAQEASTRTRHQNETAKPDSKASETKGAAGMEQSHHDVGAMIPLTSEQYRRAALAVCGRAQDVKDAALLLDALGLRVALHAVAVPA